jgi:hypothetical protein
VDGTSRRKYTAEIERKKAMKKKLDLDQDAGKVDDVIIYCGRRWFGGAEHRHVYIVKSTGEQAKFKVKLQRLHEVGEGYPAKIIDKGVFSTWNSSVEQGQPVTVEPPVSSSDIAQWIRSDAETARAVKAQRESKGLETAARKAADTVKAQYQRAAPAERRAMVRAFVERLEG